jgi:hypothetical protein
MHHHQGELLEDFANQCIANDRKSRREEKDRYKA